MTMHRLFVVILTLALATCARAQVTNEQVEKAITKAKQYLYSQQNELGTWDLPKPGEGHQGSQFGGWTAIATYGLLAGGESPQDERIKKAIEFLARTEIKGIYALGMRANVWPFLPKSDQVMSLARRDAELLLKAADKMGRFGYRVTGGGQHNSPSQYGVLGLWACAQMGIEIPSAYWQSCEDGWRQCQGGDGGWGYPSVVPEKGKVQAAPGKAVSSGTMTTAGLASLFVTQDYLRFKDGLSCNGNITNPNIQAGLEWLTRNHNPAWHGLYYLYGVERVGVASGYKYFGKIDWYDAAANALVRAQGANGQWSDHGAVPGTAWGIIVLTRGRAPVVMNKLQYFMDVPARRTARARDAGKSDAGKEANWNQRPRDIANVTKWMARQIERDLNWQIVDLDAATASDLHDAPLLYMSGDQKLDLKDEHVAKIKNFIQSGGILVGHADCGKTSFARSFQEMGEKLFPGYKFRKIEDTHPILRNQMFPASKFKSKVELLALSNGARELMVLFPNGDPAKTWQIGASSGKEEPYQMAANLFLYSVDKQNLRFKGDTYLIARDEKIKADRTLIVARLQYADGWDPEPGGWERLANYLHNQFKLDIETKSIQPGEGKLAGSGAKMAHLTGTGAFELGAEARKEIKAFVDGGGTLVVDAAGGAGEFATAAEKELKGIFGQDGAKSLEDVLKPEHDLYALAPSPIKDVDYRSFARKSLVGENLKAPRLRGIQVGGRTGVFYSREDLSVGIVGQPVDGIYGYDPVSATKLMGNLILYAAGAGRAPTTAPSTQTAGTQPVTKKE